MFSSIGHFDEMSRHFVEILSLLLTILFKNKVKFFYLFIFFFFWGGGGGGGGRGNKRVIDSHLQFCMCSKFSYTFQKQWRIQRGFGGLLAPPPPPLVFKFRMKMK